MTKTNIEWTTESWNPVVGCSVLSPGCTNCYAMAMAHRIEAANVAARAEGRTSAAWHYDGTTKLVNGHAVWTGKLALAPEHTLLGPLKRKKPTTYFVNSMGDLFHEDCPDEWIDKVFAVMALCPQHTFQILTKRAERMREYMTDPDDGLGHINTMHRVWDAAVTLDCRQHLSDEQSKWLDPDLPDPTWPLPNVWLGVSAERQQEADERIPHLLQTPAAVRFVSAEPLLGAIDLTRIRAPIEPEDDPEAEWLFDSLSTGDYCEQRFRNDFGDVWYDSGDGPYRETKINWVIAGAESGPGARDCDVEWVRNLKNQCTTADVPFFYKQHAIKGRKITTPELDGRRWIEMPVAAS